MDDYEAVKGISSDENKNPCELNLSQIDINLDYTEPELTELPPSDENYNNYLQTTHNTNISDISFSNFNTLPNLTNFEQFQIDQYTEIFNQNLIYHYNKIKQKRQQENEQLVQQKIEQELEKQEKLKRKIAKVAKVIKNKMENERIKKLVKEMNMDEKFGSDSGISDCEGNEYMKNVNLIKKLVQFRNKKNAEKKMDMLNTNNKSSEESIYYDAPDTKPETLLQ